MRLLALPRLSRGVAIGRLPRGAHLRRRPCAAVRHSSAALQPPNDGDDGNGGASSSAHVASIDAELLANELRYLEGDDLRRRYESLEKAPPWEEFKAAATAAAEPVDARVRPIYATLTLSFVAQGIQFPVLPQLARSLELSTADLGLVTATTALARLLANAPAAALAERIGRRPLLMAGPAMAGVGMGLLAVSSSFWGMVAANSCLGTGLATTMAGAQLYLADISTPRNRAATTAPILQSALLGFAIGPAIGGVMAQSLGLTLPFVVCAGGLAASAGASALLLPETLHESRRRAEMLRRWSASEQPPTTAATPPSATGDTAGTAATAATAAPPEDGMMQRLLRRPALQGIGTIAFVNGFSQGAFPVTIVLFAIEHMHMTSSAVGGMLTANVACMVLATRPATKLSDHVTSRKDVMLPAMTLAAIFTGLQPLSDGPWTFAALSLCGGVSSAFSMPSISPLILDNVSNEERAHALAGRQMAQDSGALLGASSLGFVAGAFGIPAAMYTVAVMQLASAGLFAARVPRIAGAHNNVQKQAQ